MTAAALYVASPTFVERAGLRIADAITAHVARRMERRAERRAFSLDLLRQEQARKADAAAVDRALLLVGSRPR